MADIGVSLFLLFDKDSCVFQPLSLSGLLHGVVGLSFPAVSVVVL